jgi:hypothetical protein
MKTAIENFEKAYIQDGIVFWKSNDRSPFADMLETFVDDGLIDADTMARTVQAKGEQDVAAIAEYVAHRQTNGYTREERVEMRNAFGNDDVIDVFTGSKVGV